MFSSRIRYDLEPGALRPPAVKPGPAAPDAEGERDDEILAGNYSAVSGFYPVVGANGETTNIDNHNHHNYNYRQT